MAEINDDALRAQARESFWKVAKDGMYNVLQEASTVWKGSDAKLYRTEKQLLLNHLDPYYWGVVVTTFLFVTFRVSGSKSYIQFRDKYILKKSPLVQDVSNRKVWLSHIEREMEKREQLREEVTRLPMDLMLSVLCGCSSILWLSNPRKVHQDFSEAPLTAGKSLIYKHMCPSMIHAYDTKVGTGVFQTKDDELLKTFDTFVQNCKIRAAVIADREKNNEKRPDVIPYPGIKGISRRFGQ